MNKWRWLTLGTCLLALTVTFSWGLYENDSVYITFNEVGQWSPGSLPASFGVSPIYFVILWLATQLGLSLELVSLIISSFCWGATAVLAVRLLPISTRVAVVTAVFITLSPALTLVAGTHIPVALAAIFLALLLTKQQAWSTQTLVLLLLPLLHFDLSTLIFLLALLGMRWQITGRLPMQISVLLLTLYSIWWVLIGLAFDFTRLFAPPPPLTDFLTMTAELSWILIPIAGLGLLSLKSQSLLRVVVGWTAVSFILSGAIGSALTVVTLWLLVGCGIHHLLNLLQTDDPRLLGAMTLPLLALSLWSLGQAYIIRPIVHDELENQASDWLQINSQPQATLLASAHILHSSQRSGAAWPANSISQPSALAPTIQTTTPDYLVTARNLPFDQLQRAAWFQENYVALQQFNSAYESTAPLTIWGYRPTVYNLGEGRPLNVQTDHNLNIVGYQYEPARLQPGQDLYLTLFLQATKPITTPLNTWLRLTPFNGSQEWVRQITPITAVITPNTIHPQTITTTLPADTPIGAYQLSFSLQQQGQENVLALYRNNDINMLDRVGLGNVIILEEATTDETVAINANFSEQITLLSYALSLQSDVLVLDLFWQANQTPNTDYVVFVHLLGSNEQLAANQDAPPLDGRFPTTAWLPNDIIPDRHIIPLNPDISGSYQLNIGLYHPQTGERLPILNSDGAPIANNALTLQIIEIK